MVPFAHAWMIRDEFGLEEVDASGKEMRCESTKAPKRDWWKEVLREAVLSKKVTAPNPSTPGEE